MVVGLISASRTCCPATSRTRSTYPLPSTTPTLPSTTPHTTARGSSTTWCPDSDTGSDQPPLRRNRKKRLDYFCWDSRCWCQWLWTPAGAVTDCRAQAGGDVAGRRGGGGGRGSRSSGLSRATPSLSSFTARPPLGYLVIQVAAHCCQAGTLGGKCQLQRRCRGNSQGVDVISYNCC